MLISYFSNKRFRGIGNINIKAFLPKIWIFLFPYWGGNDYRATDTSSDVLLCIVYMSFIPIIIQSLRIVLYNSKVIKNIQRNALKSFLLILVYVTCTILWFTSVMNFIAFDVKLNTESAGTYTAYVYILFISVFLIGLFGLTVSFWWNLRQQAKLSENDELREVDLRKTTFWGSVLFSWFRTNNFMHYFYPCYFTVIFKKKLSDKSINFY